MKRLQLVAIILLSIGATSLIASMINYLSFLNWTTNPSLQGCDSCGYGVEGAIRDSMLFGIIAALLIGGGILSLAMDRKREYLRAHGYL